MEEHAHWAAFKTEMQRERLRRKSPTKQQTCDKEPILTQLLSELNVFYKMCLWEDIYIRPFIFLDILEEARKNSGPWLTDWLTANWSVAQGEDWMNATLDKQARRNLLL